MGHACSPRRGSELAGTWNWAWSLSQKYRVWVLTHPQEQDYIRAFLDSHPNANLNFVWVTLPRWLDTWKPHDTNSQVGLRHYLLWQWIALQNAKLLHREIGFDLVHHVSWGSVSVPPLLWRLPVPFVWGPVGGGQVAPSSFREYLGPDTTAELLRGIRVGLVPFRPSVRKAARKAAMIFVTNHETESILKEMGANHVKLFLDSGIHESFLPEVLPQRASSLQITILWVGRLVATKCLPLVLEALDLTKDLDIRLVIAGQGPMRNEWEGLVRELGLGDRVEFLGQVSYNQMPVLYRSADVFIFTSLRDSFGSQVLEAMASGLPVVVLNHQGAGAFVPEEAGIKVAVTNPQETVSRLASAIRYLSNSRHARNEMGHAAWQFARTQTWTRRAEVMSRHYEEAIRLWRDARTLNRRDQQAGLQISMKHSPANRVFDKNV